MARVVAVAVLWFLVLVPAPARAQAQDSGLVENVAVRNRLFSVSQRFELGVNAGFTLVTRLTDHYAFSASVGYNILEWLGVELRGGYALSVQTPLAEQIRDEFYRTRSITRVSDFADLWQMDWNGVLGLRFQPIYGKLNLLAELPVHFQLYLWAGGGAARLRRESLVICVEASNPAACGKYLTEGKVSPLVSLAVGFRFFVAEHHGIRLEARSYSWLDSYAIDVDRAAITAADPTAGGRPSPNAGITTLTQVDLGYTFVF